MPKIMISIRDESFRLLSLEARERGITIQELLRAVVVPDWARLRGVSLNHRGDTGTLTVPILKEKQQSRAGQRLIVSLKSPFRNTI